MKIKERIGHSSCPQRAYILIGKAEKNQIITISRDEYSVGEKYQQKAQWWGKGLYEWCKDFGTGDQKPWLNLQLPSMFYH